VINILLASYNGEKYIADQLNSIINQTYTNWQLYIRDDGSTDNTLNIIKKYQQTDLRIHLITDELGNLGSCQNFSALMNSIKNENKYIMFCDQDDVWLPSKIEDTFNEIIRLEAKYRNIPLLLHTNFTYADLNLKPIKSKKHFKRTKITNPEFSNVVCQNSALGCTMMINKKLLYLIGGIPKIAENHDYWIALVASAFGKIFYLDKKTLLYRQHFGNLSPHYNYDSFSKRFRRIFVDKKNFEDVKLKLQMAQVFKEIYYNQLSNDNKKVIDDFLSLSKKRNLPLLIRNIKNGIRRQTFSQTLLFYLTLVLAKRNAVANSLALLLFMFVAI
jgi:rhamnosyltransferase